MAVTPPATTGAASGTTTFATLCSSESPLVGPAIGAGLEDNPVFPPSTQVARTPLSDLIQSEASCRAELSAHATLRGALSSLRSALRALNPPAALLPSPATATARGAFSHDSSPA